MRFRAPAECFIGVPSRTKSTLLCMPGGPPLNRNKFKMTPVTVDETIKPALPLPVTAAPRQQTFSTGSFVLAMLTKLGAACRQAVARPDLKIQGEIAHNMKLYKMVAKIASREGKRYRDDVIRHKRHTQKLASVAVRQAAMEGVKKYREWEFREKKRIAQEKRERACLILMHA